MLLPQSQNRTFKVHGVPQRDRGNHQVQPAGPIALIFEGTIANFAKSIEENSSREGVARFPFVEAYLNPSAQRGILKPMESKQRALKSRQTFVACDLAHSG